MHLAQDRSRKGRHATFPDLVHTGLLVHGGHAVARQSIPAKDLCEAEIFRPTQATQTHVRFEKGSFALRRIDHVQPLSHCQVVVLGPQSGLALRVVGIRH